MMTSDERQHMRTRLNTLIADVDAAESHDNEHVKAPLQDEDLLSMELDAVRKIYAYLEPMSSQAQERVIAHVVGFLHEQTERERQDMANAFANIPAEMPSPMRDLYAPEQRRR